MPNKRLRLVTWNVHGFVGSDNRWDPQRAVDVLQQLEPDLVALQEVDARLRPRLRQHPLDLLASKLDATAIAGPTLGRPGYDYGNAVLSRLPILDVQRYDLSRRDAEPRGALDVRVVSGDRAVRLVAVHLGLRRRERIEQAIQLSTELRRQPRATDLVTVAGDLNAWLPRALEARILERTVGRSLAPRTFPSKRPLLRLDRVFVCPQSAISDSGVVKDPHVRAASDHLPVWVDLDLDSKQGDLDDSA